MPDKIREVTEKIEDYQKRENERKHTARSAQIFEDIKNHVATCFTASKHWRKSSYEGKWDKYFRNVREIYDPDRLEQKEEWQIKMFVPLTRKHKERVRSQIYKTLMGAHPHYDIETRPGGDPEQAKLLKQILNYFIDKSDFALNFDSQVDNAATYGSGYCKTYWVDRKEKRKIREPVRKKIPLVDLLTSLMTKGKLPDVVKYKTKEKEVSTYRGVRYDWVDIHDIFPDPTNLEDSWVIHRTKMKYGDLVKGAADGYFYEDAVERLKDKKEDEYPEPDKQTEKNDKDENIIPPVRTDYEKVHTVCEMWGRFPRKWIYWNERFSEKEGNEIIPGRIFFTADGQEILGIEENDSYDGRPPLDKFDYIRNPGEHYGSGVPELLNQLQDELNELRNQRVDNATLKMNLLLAVMEDALVDGEQDLKSKAGGVLRINRKRYDDVKKAITKIDLGHTDRSDFQETLELEKEAQETTGIGRVTLGSGGYFAKDTNQTARGMQMLRQASLELINYYTALMELSAFVNIIRRFYVLIYENITLEEIRLILGPEKALKFELLPIEEVEKYYKFKPTGTFTMANKPQKAQALMMFRNATAGSPYIKELEFEKRMASMLDIEDIDELFKTEEEMQMQAPQQGIGVKGHEKGKMPQERPPSSASKEIPAMEEKLEAPLE